MFMSPCRIARFIISTRHLRSLAKAKEAQADTLRAAFDDDADLTHQPVNPPSRRFLIRARPRFDVVMMLMRRHALSQRARDIRTAPLWYYMADASPASGFESFSIVENMADGNMCEYRLAPCTFLAVGKLSLRHTTFSFPWALWLEVGPSQQALRLKLSNIYGFTTDRGVERAIADADDVLPDLLATFGVATNLSRGQHLFPKAMWVPGLHHMLGNSVEQILSALDFWPSILQRLKQAVRFLRIDAHRQKLVRAVEAEHDLDTSTLRSKPPTFANWRWDTLADVQSWFEMS